MSGSTHQLGSLPACKLPNMHMLGECSGFHTVVCKKSRLVSSKQSICAVFAGDSSAFLATTKINALCALVCRC